MNTTETLAQTASPSARYLPPGPTDRLFNRLVRRLTRLGLSVWGSRELRVLGRRSGKVRSTVVNVLTVGDRRYLVAPRGTTDWVRNLRAAGGGELRVGHRVEAFHCVEVADEAKPEVLRPYLRRWAFEVGRFFDGVEADADHEQLLAIAANHPIFELEGA